MSVGCGTNIHVLAVAVGKEMGTGRQEKIWLLNSHWKLPESEKNYKFTHVSRAPKSKSKKQKRGQ